MSKVVPAKKVTGTTLADATRYEQTVQGRRLLWTTDLGGWLQVRGELLEKVLAALQAANIEIPYQQLDIHLRKPTRDQHE